MLNTNSGKTWVKDNPSAYQLHDITHFPDWRNLIVWDAFFNNLTSGLMLITAIAWLAGGGAFAWLLPIPMTVALLIVGVDLVLLIADLGDPWRFYHSLRVLRFTSPLSVGVWGLVSYTTFLAIAVVLTWLAWFAGPTLLFLKILARLFTVFAVMGATVVICYKGVVFSCSSQPGVRDARWLTTFMVSDSLLMGLALYLLITLLFAPAATAIALIMPFVILVCVRCGAFGLLWQDVKRRARRVYPTENKVVMIMVFGIGGLLAAILAFCGVYGLILASLLVLCCGAVERYWLIGLTQPM